MERFEDEVRFVETPHEESDGNDGSDGDDHEVTGDGPLSLHLSGIEAASQDEMSSREQEQHELSYLRLENTLLKKKVKALERLSRGDKRNAKLVVDETEMNRINELLQKAADAKAEAMDYVANTSRDKLGQDVKVLQSILKKAKAERHAFKKKIKAAEDKLVLEKHRIEKEEIRFQIDREIFAKILQDDRDAYKHEVSLLVQKLTEVHKEKHDLFLFTKDQHERHLQEIRKLTRALGRTKKMVDDHKRASENVLTEVCSVQRTVLPPPPPPLSPTGGSPPFDACDEEPVVLTSA